jgi:anti-sigma factor RsiW
MSMSCQEDLRTQSYLDGELHGANATVAGRHLQSCPECQALAAGTADLSDALRNATRHKAPAPLRARLATQPDRETARRHARSFWYGAVCGGGLTALAAGFALLALLPPSAATLTQSVADARMFAL